MLDPWRFLTVAAFNSNAACLWEESLSTGKDLFQSCIVRGKLISHSETVGVVYHIRTGRRISSKCPGANLRGKVRQEEWLLCTRFHLPDGYPEFYMPNMRLEVGVSQEPVSTFFYFCLCTFYLDFTLDQYISDIPQIHQLTVSV